MERRRLRLGGAKALALAFDLVRLDVDRRGAGAVDETAEHLLDRVERRLRVEGLQDLERRLLHLAAEPPDRLLLQLRAHHRRLLELLDLSAQRALTRRQLLRRRRRQREHLVARLGNRGGERALVGGAHLVELAADEAELAAHLRARARLW